MIVSIYFLGGSLLMCTWGGLLPFYLCSFLLPLIFARGAKGISFALSLHGLLLVVEARQEEA